MPFSSENYKNTLWLLIPKGLLWRRNEGDGLDLLLAPAADEFAEIDAHANGLRYEFPGTATELLTDWEASVGLPDECLGTEELDDDARRLAVLARLTDIPDSTPAGIEALLERAGFTATVQEYAEISGDIDALFPAGQREHVWRLLIESDAASIYFEAGIGRAGDPLLSFKIPALECLIDRIKPAHTLALFAYIGGA